MTMIEKVARAIYEVRNGPGAARWDRMWEAHKQPYLSDARAAIEAMREPSEGMVGAAYRDDDSGMMLSVSYSDIYRAMIDAALKEGE